MQFPARSARFFNEGRSPSPNSAFCFRAIRLALFSFLLWLALGVSGQEKAIAQTGDDAWLLTERLPASGARLMGMGGASVGGVSNASVMVTNPAGLGYYEASEASGALNAMVINSTARYRVANPTEETENAFGVVPSSGNLVYNFPVERGSFVVAGGFNQRGTYRRTLGYDATNTDNTVTATLLPFDDEYHVGDDLGLEFSADHPFMAFEAGAIEFYPDLYEEGEYPFDQAILLGSDNRQVGELVERGQITEINFGAAIEAMRFVMVGVSANVIHGEYSSDHYHQETLEREELEPYVVVRGDQDYVGFERFEFTDRRESTVTGASLRLGASWWFARAFRLGATLESPSYYRVENTFNGSMETFFQDGQSLSFSEASGEFERADYEYDILTPWRASVGGKLLARDFAGIAGEFVVSGDVEFVDWSQMELRADGDASVYEIANEDIRGVYGSVFNTRIGGELYIGPAVVRTGFAHFPDPREEMLVPTDDFTDDRNRTILSLGAGWLLQPGLELDVAWVQERVTDTYFPYTDPDAFLTSPPIRDNLNRHLIMVGMRYFF